MSALSVVFFEPGTGNEVGLPTSSNSITLIVEKLVLQFRAHISNESIILEHMSVTRSTVRMFMLPANEAKGSKHCCLFAMLYGETKVMLYVLNVCWWHLRNKKDLDGIFVEVKLDSSVKIFWDEPIVYCLWCHSRLYFCLRMPLSTYFYLSEFGFVL